MIDYILDPEKYGEETVDQARRHDQFMQQINYLLEEGVIYYKEDKEGNIRLFPAS